jgi:hypothetical protein
VIRALFPISSVRLGTQLRPSLGSKLSDGPRVSLERAGVRERGPEMYRFLHADYSQIQ